MASKNECLAAVEAAVGKEKFAKLSDNFLDDIFTRMNNRVENRLVREVGKTRQQVTAEVAKELVDDTVLTAAQKKRERIENAMKEASLLDYTAKYKGKNKIEAVRSALVGIEGSTYGAGQNVDAQSHSIFQRYQQGIVNDLRRIEGGLEVARLNDPVFEKDLAREIARQNGGDVQPTGNRLAEQIAAVVAKYTEASRVNLNAAGAHVGKMAGYIVRQSHDQLKISKAGYEAWRDAILPKLDPRTFDDVDPTPAAREKFLRNVWENLASGNHNRRGKTEDTRAGFRGTSNLATRLSEDRVLHFKGPDEWLEYNNQFGRGSLYEAFLDGLRYSARNEALLRRFGTNPENMLNKLIENAKEQSRREGKSEPTGEFLLHNEFKAVSGMPDFVGSATWATWGAGLRTAMTLSKLGGVVAASIPDIATRASLLRHNGIPLLEGYGNAVSSLVKNQGKEAGDLLAYGAQGIIGDIFRQVHSTDNMPGFMAKMVNNFFKINGLNFWTDRMGAGVASALARNLYNQIEAGRGFGQLDQRLRTTLTRYGIGEPEWNLLRQVDFKAEGAHPLVGPDAITGLTDAQIKTYLGGDAGDRAIKAARRDLEIRLSTYIGDQVREAMSEAGARQRALVTGGTEAGTPLGEVIRMLMQFKTYPVTFMQRTLGRELYRGEGVDKSGLFFLMAGTTILGYVSMTAKELAKGRNPRDIEKDPAKVMMAAMLQGGGFGLYGDFLFGEANRFGGGLAASLAGPTVGTADQLMKVLQSARDGAFTPGKEAGDAGGKAIKFVADNLPFQNLHVFGLLPTRMALDVMFLRSLQEWANPGSLYRYQRNVERENNQTFWLPPTVKSLPQAVDYLGR